MGASLDTDLLRAFVTIAEMGSFTKAASLLSRTQSAISLQMRRLEEQLDTALLHRDSRGVRLTSAGEAFLIYARRLLALEDEAIRSVRGQPVDRLRIGIPDVYAERLLPAALSRLAETHPEVQPEVVCDVSTELVAQLEAGALDVTLTVEHDRSQSGEILAEESLFWVAGEGLSLESAEPVPLALYPEYCVYRAQGLRALAAAGRGWRVVYTSQSTAAIDIAIDCGWAVALKSESTIRDRWHVLGHAHGMPPLEPVRLELRRSPAKSTASLQTFAALLAEEVRRADGP